MGQHNIKKPKWIHKIYAGVYFAVLTILLSAVYNFPVRTASAAYPSIIVKNVRYSLSSKDKVKIEISLSKASEIRYNHLKNPERLYVDILDASISRSLKRVIRSDVLPVKLVRTAQNQKDRVRIVMNMDNNISYTVTRVENPPKVVISFTQNKKKTSKIRTAKVVKKSISVASASIPAMRRKTIVIDPGHGGKDPGAMGKNGLMEKDVVLSISKKLAKIIKKNYACNVVLTRDKDIFIPVRKRPVISNKLNADLFISIHANADKNPKTRGTEVYYLSPSTSRSILKIAARENMVTVKDMEKNDLQFILEDLKSTFKINESIVLGNHIQKFLIKGLKSKYKRVKNLGVKKGPFYVLLGSDSPSILVESLFITNKDDNKVLRNDKQRQVIAESIFKGINKYLRETVVAFKR